jgi:hypothetical protein
MLALPVPDVAMWPPTATLPFLIETVKGAPSVLRTHC